LGLLDRLGHVLGPSPLVRSWWDCFALNVLGTSTMTKIIFQRIIIFLKITYLPISCHICMRIYQCLENFPRPTCKSSSVRSTRGRCYNHNFLRFSAKMAFSQKTMLWSKFGII
jgi:hypothetical protein